MFSALEELRANKISLSLSLSLPSCTPKIRGHKNVLRPDRTHEKKSLVVKLHTEGRNICDDHVRSIFGACRGYALILSLQRFLLSREKSGEETQGPCGPSEFKAAVSTVHWHGNGRITSCEFFYTF